MTIAERFDSRRNSLNFLRLVLATAVIFSHAWPLGGFGPDPQLARQTVGTWAVGGFFAISGYLIAASRLHTSLWAFIARRVLRIYPGFLVCLVVVAVVFAPLSVAIGPGSYDPASAVSFVVHNMALKIEQNGILHTIDTVPYGAAWNGSLWTLFYEFVCYLIIGLILSAPQRWQRPLAIAAFCAAALGGTYAAHHQINQTLGDLCALLPIFLAGSLLYLFSDRIRLDWRAGIAGAICLPLAIGLNTAQSVGAVLMAYECMWLGAALPFTGVGRRNDISYGVYIYAFPVQQTLVLLHLNRYGVLLYALLSTVVTLPLAAASWFAVERPAIRLKYLLARRSGNHSRRLPGPGLNSRRSSVGVPSQESRTGTQPDPSAAAGQ